MLEWIVWTAILCGTLTGCDSQESEIARHSKAYEGTYYVPSPWRNDVPLSKRENPEDGRPIDGLHKSKPAWSK